MIYKIYKLDDEGHELVDVRKSKFGRMLESFGIDLANAIYRGESSRFRVTKTNEQTNKETVYAEIEIKISKGESNE